MLIYSGVLKYDCCFCGYVASVCHLPMNTGDCDGICPRWFFNTHSGRCEEFSYGCCGGNENKFQTEQECLNACNNGTGLYYAHHLILGFEISKQ